WMAVFGKSIISIRLLSIIYGVLCVWVVFLLAKESLGEKVALLSAFLVAISPFHIHYSQEIRMYILYCLLLISATYALFQAVQTQKTKWWVLFAVFAALSQYTHNIAAIYLIPLALSPILKKDWLSLRKSILSSIGAALLYLPWLMILPSQIRRVAQTFWIAPPGVERILSTLLTFVVNLPLEGMLLVIGLIITILLLTFALWHTTIVLKSKDGLSSDGIWFAYLAFAPPLFLFLLSQWFPVFVERALLPSAVMFLIWLAWVIRESSFHKVVNIFLLFLIVISGGIGLFQHISYQGFPYAPYKELGDYLQNHASPNDLIVHSNKLSVLSLGVYFPTLSHEFVADPPGDGSDIFKPATQKALGFIASPTIEEAVSGNATVWFIIFNKAIEEFRAIGEETHPHINWLNQHYELIAVDEWGSLQLHKYIKH
ncbi:MAG: glycosyltransferase family 39 protein, partial [Chloroflexota bacterium]